MVESVLSMADRSERTTAVSAPSLPPQSVGECSVIIISGPDVGAKAVLKNQPLVIGRSEECDFTIDSESISRRHVKIDPAPGGGYVVRDLGSTNGTKVNQVKITDHPLEDGDLIKVGKAVLKFVAPGNPEGRYLQEMGERASADALTGVANRRQFDERLNAEAAKIAFSGASLSLILLDIDHFKQINDTHGHPTGDQVLVEVARLAGHCLRPGNVIARVGGEEFAILCPNTDLGAARSLAQMIRATVEHSTIEFEGTNIDVTVSIGVAAASLATGGGSAQDLYKAADAKLYEAKAAGRNCVR